MTVVHCHGLCQKKKQATGIPDNVSCIRGRRLRQLWVGKYQGKQNLACSMNLEGLLDQKKTPRNLCIFFLLSFSPAPRTSPKASVPYIVLFRIVRFCLLLFFPGYHHPRVICSVQRRANPPKKSPSRRASAVWVDAQGTHTHCRRLFHYFSLSRSLALSFSRVTIRQTANRGPHPTMMCRRIPPHTECSLHISSFGQRYHV